MPEVRLIDNIAIKEQLRAIEQNSKLTDAQKFRSAKFVIENAPTIEAEPVRHGRWIVHTTWHGMFGLIHSECSECKFDRNGDLSSWKFCPNCGRDMRATDTNDGSKGGADNA